MDGLSQAAKFALPLDVETSFWHGYRQLREICLLSRRLVEDSRAYRGALSEKGGLEKSQEMQGEGSFRRSKSRIVLLLLFNRSKRKVQVNATKQALS